MKKLVNGFVAVMWKEFRSMRYRIKGLLFSIGVSLLLFFFASIMKIYTMKGVFSNNVIAAQQISIYVSGIIGYMALIYTLRFWEEKSMKTIDTLFSTPLSIRLIMLAKVMASLVFSELAVICAFIFYSIVFKIVYSVNILSLGTIIITLAIPILFNIPFGLINGYTMWCLSVGAAKLIQMISIGIFFGALASIWSGIDKTGISSALISGLLAAAIVLWIVGFYCLLFANKEKTVLNMPD